VNFEVSLTGGYTRIAGYERFDGRPSPSAASYGVVTLDSVAGVAVGNTIGNLAAAPTKTGIVIAVSGLNVVFTKAVGSFVAADSVYVGAALIGTVQSTAAFTADAMTQATYTALASDVYRADIGVVPGTGPIRGVVSLNGAVYAWRNNAGNSAMAIYKSSSTGWQAVSLGYELPFSTGTGAEIAEGVTVTNAGATATGVVARVVQETVGGWAGATGRLILSSVTGTWANGDQIQVAGVQHATATGAATPITLAPNGRVETVVSNIVGNNTAKRIYGADGVNHGFEFDGTTYVPIHTGMVVDTPAHVAVHKNYLFFSFGTSVQNSGLATPYTWSPILGANELALPDTVTAFKSMPGDAYTAALAIYTKADTYLLYGVASGSWQLVPFDRGTGAAAYTVQTIVDAYGLDDRGAISLSTSRNYGNFDSATLTFAVQPFVQARRGLATASAVNREKSQYRIFYSDGSGLYITIVNGKLKGSMPVLFPDAVNCWCDSDVSAAMETSYFGGMGSGYVYRLDVGPDFDGAAISAQVLLNFNPQGSARVLKRYRRASLEVAGTGYADFQFSYQLGYDTTDIEQPSAVDYSLPFTSASWDSFVWDSFVWDGKSLSPSEVAVAGTAENIAIYISSTSRLNQPFTVNSVALHYSTRRGIR
jgi:hypothetical protein